MEVLATPAAPASAVSPHRVDDVTMTTWLRVTGGDRVASFDAVYERGERIGSGGFGEIVAVARRECADPAAAATPPGALAAKFMPLRHGSLEAATREAVATHLCSHPHVTPIRDVRVVVAPAPASAGGGAAPFAVSFIMPRARTSDALNYLNTLYFANPVLPAARALRGTDVAQLLAAFGAMPGGDAAAARHLHEVKASHERRHQLTAIAHSFSSPLEVGYVLYTLLLALAAMHARGVVHRDIKLENLLVDKVHMVQVATLELEPSPTTGALLPTRASTIASYTGIGRCTLTREAMDESLVAPLPRRAPGDGVDPLVAHFAARLGLHDDYNFVTTFAQRGAPPEALRFAQVRALVEKVAYMRCLPRPVAATAAAAAPASGGVSTAAVATAGAGAIVAPAPTPTAAAAASSSSSPAVVMVPSGIPAPTPLSGNLASAALPLTRFADFGKARFVDGAGGIDSVVVETSADGRVRLLTAPVVGTPQYTAPEVHRAVEAMTVAAGGAATTATAGVPAWAPFAVDAAAADVFSLSMSLSTMLASAQLIDHPGLRSSVAAESLHANRSVQRALVAWEHPFLMSAHEALVTAALASRHPIVAGFDLRSARAVKAHWREFTRSMGVRVAELPETTPLDLAVLLLGRMCAYEPVQRPTAAEALADPWLAATIGSRVVPPAAATASVGTACVGGGGGVGGLGATASTASTGTVTPATTLTASSATSLASCGSPATVLTFATPAGAVAAVPASAAVGGRKRRRDDPDSPQLTPLHYAGAALAVTPGTAVRGVADEEAASGPSASKRSRSLDIGPAATTAGGAPGGELARAAATVAVAATGRGCEPEALHHAFAQLQLGAGATSAGTGAAVAPPSA